MHASQPVARAVILVLAGVMLLGILSSRGRYTIVAGILAVLATVLYVVFTQSKVYTDTASTGDDASIAYGVILVVAGAIVGIIGGFCIRRRGST